MTFALQAWMVVTKMFEPHIEETLALRGFGFLFDVDSARAKILNMVLFSREINFLDLSGFSTVLFSPKDEPPFLFLLLLMNDSLC